MSRLVLEIVSPTARTPLIEREVLRRAFPGVSLQWPERPARGGALIEAASWHCAPFPDAVDLAIASGQRPVIVARASAGILGIAAAILTRYQHAAPRTNARSATRRFAQVLKLHRRIHDITRPLVWADYAHAVDTWQWLLRLEPHTGEALQIAALFHDVHRADSEGERRIAHLALAYRRSQWDPACVSAEAAASRLAGEGLPAGLVQRAHELIAHHEWPTDDPEVALLNDADGISFLSLNSAGYRDYFGEELTRDKVRYTLARISHRARAILTHLRLRPDVAKIVDDLGGGRTQTAVACSHL